MSSTLLDLKFDYHLETYLSTNVHQLLCVTGIHKKDLTNHCQNIFNDGLLRWNIFSENFVKPSLKNNDDFVEGTEQMAALFNQIHRYYSDFSMSDYQLRLSHYTEWTAQCSLITRCFAVLKNDDDATAVIHALLILTAVLERALGDLVLLRAKQCPSLLKDLLAMPELQELLSPSVIKFLLLLVGPPFSLNLRNISWHGFLQPGEVCEQYPYAILCTIISLGNLLNTKGIDSIPHREMATVLSPSVFGQLNSSLVEEIRQVFSNSLFIVPVMRPLWNLALSLFDDGRFGESLVLILPQLELALRRIFVAANGCSERLLTAESATLFTTLDEILSQRVNEESENRLRLIIGDSYLTMLMDCLVYPLGPRIRDRVSHGEVDILEQSCDTVSHMICTCAALALQFLAPDARIVDSPFILSLRHTANSYESLYHTVSVCKQQICSCADSLSNWSNIRRPDELDFISVTQQDDEIQPVQKVMGHFTKLFPPDPQLNVLLVMVTDYKVDFRSEIINKLKSCHPNTLYRYGTDSSVKEEEVVRLLIRIGKLMIALTGQIVDVAQHKYEQWQRKEMRSRQRTNYVRLLKSVQVITTGMQVIVLAMTLTFCHMNNLSMNKSHDLLQNELIKYFKAVQKYLENLLTYTRIDNNRWDEACIMTKELFTKMRSFST